MLNLTYEDVLKICQMNESFKMKTQVFGDTTVAQITYFLASPGDFFDAHKDGSMVRATELRGLMFIRKGEGEWKRHLFLDKFFNINQSCGCDITKMDLTINGKTFSKININTLFADADEKVYRALDLKVGQTVGEYDRGTEEVGELFTIETLDKEILPTENKENSWMYDDVKDLEIVRIANKEDGSAIRFFMLNGVLSAKTKFSLEAEQAEMAMEVVNSNAKLKAFILKTLEDGLAALFEIVSPFNKIVLSYNETALKLLQLRVEDTGEYLNIYENDLVKEFDVLTTDQEEIRSLDELFVEAETVENKEGWVITFANGKMAKIKGSWYLNIHGILENGLREHKLINKVLNEEIDDILAHIPVDAHAERDFINDLTEVIVGHVNEVATEAQKFFNDNFDGSRKDYAIKFRKHKLFSMTTVLFEENTYERIKDRVIRDVLRDTSRWERARNYLKDLGFERELRLIESD